MIFHKPTEQAPQPSIANRLALLVMLVATGIIVHHSWIARGFQFDDALIYQRYFANFFAGKGLVYNEGVHFNGLTAPFYAYLMLAVGSVVRDLQLAAWGLSTVGLTLACWLLFRFSQKNGDGLGAALGLTIGVSLPYFYLTYGMETSVFLALIALCLRLYQMERYVWLAIAGTLLILTRAEGVFLLGALGLAHLTGRRQLPSWHILIVPAALLLLHYGFNRYYYGAFVPETGSAKIWQGQSGLWGAERPLFLHCGYLESFIFLGKRWLWVLLAVLAGFGSIVTIKRSWFVVVFVAAYAAFYCVLNIPHYHWYYAPILMAMYWYAGIGLVEVCRRLVQTTQHSTVAGLIPTLLALSCCAVITVTIMKQVELIRGPAPQYFQTGNWMNTHLPKDAKVAAVEIGTIGYYSNRYIIDILGLINPNNARYIGERKFDAWLNDYHPDYFLVHEPLWPHEVSVRHLLDKGVLWIRPDFEVGGLKIYCRAGTPDCRPIADATPAWQLKTYAVNGPLPEHVALSGGGSIDLVRLDGLTLHLTGEIAPGHAEPRTIMVSTPDAAINSKVAPFDEHVPTDSRFRIDLTFDSTAKALLAANNWCAATPREDGTVALLSTVRAPCDRLLK